MQSGWWNTKRKKYAQGDIGLLAGPFKEGQVLNNDNKRNQCGDEVMIPCYRTNQNHEANYNTEGSVKVSRFESKC